MPNKLAKLGDLRFNLNNFLLELYSKNNFQFFALQQ
jgi:hypothetical protein